MGHARQTDFMGRTSDLSPDYPTSNWDLTHPSSTWKLWPKISLSLDSPLVWKYNIQRWLWWLSFMKVQFWQAVLWLAFWTERKYCLSRVCLTSTLLTDHKASHFLVKVTFLLLLDFYWIKKLCSCRWQWSACASLTIVDFFTFCGNLSWHFGTCVHSNSVIHFNHSPAVDFEIENSKLSIRLESKLQFHLIGIPVLRLEYMGREVKTSESEMRQADASPALHPSYALLISAENEWNSKISFRIGRIATASILLPVPDHFWLTLSWRRKSFRRNYKRWANWQMVGQRLTGDGPIIEGSRDQRPNRGVTVRDLRQMTLVVSWSRYIWGPEGRRILL